MIATPEDARLRRLAQKMAPGGQLLRAWPLSGGISAGMTAFELRDSAGAVRAYILRRPSNTVLAQRPSAAEDEFNLLAALQARGLPVPAPCLLDCSAEIFPAPYLVIAYIEGRPEYATDDLGAFTAEMAAHMARIHRAPVAGLDSAGLGAKVEVPSEGLGQAPAHLNRRLGEERIRAALAAAWPLPPPAAPALLHGDFWPGNLLWRDGRIAAVIDWEDARLGDPLSDLAITRLDLACIFGAAAVEAFTARYWVENPLDAAALPYWDLWAALRFIRLAGDDLEGWAAFYPPVGRADISAHALRIAFERFVAQAFEKLAS